MMSEHIPLDCKHCMYHYDIKKERPIGEWCAEQQCVKLKGSEYDVDYDEKNFYVNFEEEEKSMKRYYYNLVKKSTSQEYLVATKGFDDKDKALAQYHDDMSKVMSNPNVFYALATVTNDEGGFLVVDVYGSLDDEPEPETTEEVQNVN